MYWILNQFINFYTLLIFFNVHLLLYSKCEGLLVGYDQECAFL